jgi:membrane protein DedA with SNARE-associated domain
MTDALPWPAQEIAGWLPLWKGLGFFLATFVLEDVAAVGAGLLLATGAISWPVAFASCFLGIWSGDAGLYALARFGGRKWFERSSFKKYSPKVERSEKWFAERGTIMLIFSRCVPGARLPTYLAAGFLRLPLPRFLAVTGAAAFVWTLAILWLAQTVGVRLVHWLQAYKFGSFVLVFAVLAALVLMQLLRRKFADADLRNAISRLERLRQWEFWPPWMFYPPVALYCVWLGIRHGGLNVAAASNPGIFSGGLVGESKMATLKDLFDTSPEFTAEAALIPCGPYEDRLRIFEEARVRLALQYPFILKPDHGQRGVGVKLIRNQARLEDCLRHSAAPLLVQRYAPGPFEAGIFYYRFPGSGNGKIFGITEKIFPTVTGDGKSTIKELIERDPRARVISGTYMRRFAARLGEILPAGEILKLVEAGNHAQGCIFKDGMRWNSPQLLARLDEISRRLGGFFIGRYDIRFSSEEDLREGRNFQIIELNGAAAEAASIYDSRNTLWSAYRTLFRQWGLVYAIGAENRRRGFVPMTTLSIWSAWRAYNKLAATYSAAD